MRNPLAIATVAVLLAAIVSPGRTEERQSSVTVYTSPEINLGEIDREIIDQVGAGGYINFAAFVLSDYAIIDALRSAALRGADESLDESVSQLSEELETEASLFADTPDDLGEVMSDMSEAGICPTLSTTTCERRV
jgi:hypothetical protein